MFAVIQTGGKQYIVEPGKNIKIEKLKAAVGETVLFDDVLLVGDTKDTTIGTPTVKGTKVEATILEQGRSKKITVFKYHNKTRYRKKRGHRQYFTQVQIQKILQ